MRLRSVLREPLLHFLAIGAALFLYFRWSGPGSGPSSSRIVITAGQIDHLAAGFAQTWQRPPSAAEMKGLIDDWVREEIAMREAMAAGLDRDDTIIRRRLRQKLEFLLEDVADTAAPTEQELGAWLVTHADSYRIEPAVAFRQVYLSPDRRGAAAESDARALLARLGQAGPAAPIAALGDPSLLPQEVDMQPLSDVVHTFGQDFAERLAAVPPQTWTGPVASAYGLHLVMVRERVAGSLPDLAAVRHRVERDFQADRRKRRLAAMYEKLLEKYTVVVERPESTAATSGPPGTGGS